MAFQIKDFASIAASMINLMRGNTKKITDFQPGSVARTLIEAPAMEIEELYLKMFQGLLEAIPVATYSSFDFDLLPATPASGVLTFYVFGDNEDGVTIPEGTTVRNPTTNQDYVTTRTITIEPGDTQGAVSAVGVTPGYISNTSANTINVVVDNVEGVSGVSNLTAFSNGHDVETNEERKVRFREYIQSLQRGTVSAIRYGASTARLTDVNGAVIERAALIEVYEPYEHDPVANNPGFVIVYIHNGVGQTSLSLTDEVSKILNGYTLEDGTKVPGYVSAGVSFSVVPAVEIEVDVTATIVVKGGYDAATVIANCTTAVSEYLLSLGIGVESEAVLSEIIERIMAVDGVYDANVTDPTSNVGSAYDSKIVPGIITITEA